MSVARQASGLLVYACMLRVFVRVSIQRVASTEGIGSATTCLASARDKPGTFIYGNKSKQVVFVVGGKVSLFMHTSFLRLSHGLFDSHMVPSRQTAGSVDVTDIPICLALSNDGAEIIASTADGSVHFISTSGTFLQR